MGVTAMQAAKRACEASGWTLTNLQLQKILYLAHMIYAGRHRKPMIDDENFQAWNYGPVLPSVYHPASAFGDKPIKNIFRSVEPLSDRVAAELIDEAVARYADLPPFKLVQLTHDSNSAWSKHFSAGRRGVEIPFTSVADEYAQRFSRGS
ncbi:Panacea domain-containing protein [Achromobacter sp. CSND-B12]|uniref:Panacea domain-containing protein n=1 Tax=Achromobacter sp. CSND-B12 TaxID=3462570 RepID=UPI00406A5109